jgi:hypothetical protein
MFKGDTIMRNVSFISSVIGLCVLVFGGVLSFWIDDPVLTKATFLVSSLGIGVCCIFNVFNYAHLEEMHKDHITDFYSSLDQVYDRISASERLNDGYNSEIWSHIHDNCSKNKK